MPRQRRPFFSLAATGKIGGHRRPVVIAPIAGAAPYVLTVSEDGTPVLVGATQLDFLTGFDVLDAGGDRATVALDLSESQWTLHQDGVRFRDGSGPLLAARASGPALDLTGSLLVSFSAAVGGLAAVDLTGRQALVVKAATGDCSLFAPGAGAYIRPTVNSSVMGYAYALTGELSWEGTGANSLMTALAFHASQNGANLLWLHGVYVNLRSYVGKGTIMDSHGFEVVPNFMGNRPTTFRGLYVRGYTGMNTVYGVHVNDFLGTTIRLLEIGPSSPYLRLVGGGAPAPGQTNLYLQEQATLRHVQWKDGAAIGPGDRVMVLV